MARNSDAFSEAFMESLRRDTARWKSELSLLDADANAGRRRLETSELRSWIEAGEAIFARYEKRRG